MIYGLGGLIVPFIGIKLIDLVLVALASDVRSLAMRSQLRPAIVSLRCCCTLITGVVYPLVVTGVAKVAFPRQGGRQRDRSATARPSDRS